MLSKFLKFVICIIRRVYEADCSSAKQAGDSQAWKISSEIFNTTIIIFKWFSQVLNIVLSSRYLVCRVWQYYGISPNIGLEKD